MKTTRRMKRMTRKRLQLTRMNLTSLMDVFTILVFFLLVNSGSPETLETPKDIELPESLAEAKPRETVVVYIGQEHVLVQGEAVAKVAAIASMPEEGNIAPIVERLTELENRIIGPSTQHVARTREVTILADRRTPFAVVQRVMATCTQQGYERLSLAVMQSGAESAVETVALQS